MWETLEELAARKLELLSRFDAEKLDWLIRRHKEGAVSSSTISELFELNEGSPVLHGELLVDFWLTPFLQLSRARRPGEALAISEILAFHRATAWRDVPFERIFLPAMQLLDYKWLQAKDARLKDARERIKKR